ncbi:hypothetical protein OH492_24940 [Vibrio chagasii]|nr:hypothetical protein [Vibrio chagasii]
MQRCRVLSILNNPDSTCVLTQNTLESCDLLPTVAVNRRVLMHGKMMTIVIKASKRSNQSRYKALLQQTTSRLIQTTGTTFTWNTFHGRHVQH